MDKMQKEVLQVTKEIVVKFIESQRLSPSGVVDVFPMIHGIVMETVVNSHASVSAPVVLPKVIKKAEGKGKNNE